MGRVTADELTAERFEGRAALEALEPEWRELVAASGVDPLCNGFTFVRAYARGWLDESGPGAPFGWVLRDRDGRAQALLPFRREPARGPLALGRARLLVDGTFDSDYLDLPTRPGAERAAVECAIELLRRERGLQALVLASVPADSTVLECWRQVAAERRLPTRERPDACAVSDLAPTFEEQLGRLPKRMRSKVRQARRRAEEAGATASWCDDTGRLDEHLETLFELHALRWQSVGEAGSFAQAPRRRYYGELAHGLAAEGSLRLARLDHEGRAICLQIGALIDGTYYQLQEGYDPAVDAFRPGIALRGWALEQLIGQGARRYDFMGGDSRHKRDWNAEPRDCRTLALALPRWRGRLAYGLRAAVDRLRG
ncbi:GNAT family N-acetyltransferase [Engelhardtia mirabilis]|uniref:BioF2-like acetyltransferase domain-containing protein n=1 Tax=Engelhardtia mirabilis TaxID=2528011 RepID=A0A518BLE3_9BACT|nr:hypothetical protein Pla133_28910 [Planctomycetes bacterium Pla133]QDV02128.1 hypothetical protein Pla86_28900 [Planctomycetes bacterium Pla86]